MRTATECAALSWTMRGAAAVATTVQASPTVIRVIVTTTVWEMHGATGVMRVLVARFFQYVVHASHCGVQCCFVIMVHSDNCDITANNDQQDTDGDGVGDDCGMRCANESQTPTASCR